MSGIVISSLEQLPTEGLTVSALRSLDFVVPGEWDNIHSFDRMVAQVTGSDNPKATPARVNGPAGGWQWRPHGVQFYPRTKPEPGMPG